MTEDWTVRPASANDYGWVESTLRVGMGRNSYMHGVTPERIAAIATCVAYKAQVGRLDAAVVCTGDDDKEPAGWVIYRQVPTMTIAYAHVDEAFRGLGAWRCLREHLGLRDGQLVGVVLASPQAMGLARKRYQAKHNWGMVLEWL